MKHQETRRNIGRNNYLKLTTINLEYKFDYNLQTAFAFIPHKIWPTVIKPYGTLIEMNTDIELVRNAIKAA